MGEQSIYTFDKNVSKLVYHIMHNCSAVPVSNSSTYPRDLFTLQERLHGAIVLHIFAGFYIFIIIAYLCNDYFLPSVYCICQELKIPRDIAGATFMTLVTGGPQLSMNFIGTLLTHSDIGVGGVVGGALFNTLGISAFAGLATAVVLPLDVWPIFRESGLYVTVILLLTQVLWDNVVMWREAAMLVIIYFIILLFWFFEHQLREAAQNYFGKMGTLNASKQWAVPTLSKTTDFEMYSSTHPQCNSAVNLTVEPDLPKTNPITVEVQRLYSNEEPAVKDIFDAPEGVAERLWWLFSWPIVLALWLTIPDCRKKPSWYPLTFIMCVFWVAATSYLITWMMSVVGHTFGISDAIMGLTVLGFGASIPDALSAMFNARNGIGTMSISNGLGENSMNILMSLGLPWTIKTLMPVDMGGGPVIIQSHGLVFTNIAQVMAVVSLVSILALNGFKLSRRQGAICLAVYVLFVIAVVILELYLNNLQDSAPCH